MKNTSKIHDFELPLYQLSSGFLKFSGCYAVFDPNGTCLYVGRATDLLSRIRKRFREYEGQTFWVCHGVEHLDAPRTGLDSKIRIWFSVHEKQLEKSLINKLKPIHNNR